MSDEKLSVLLEAELQNALPCGLPCAAFRIENAAIEGHSWFCPVLRRHHVRLLLARLERERTVARSEALEWAADECEGNQRDTGLVKEHCRTWNDAVCRCADEIRKGILAPSTVSQPSRERDEARSEALEDAAKHYPIIMRTPKGYGIECECGWHSVCIRNDDEEDLMKLWQGHVRLLAPSVVSQPSREREVPLDPMLPLSLTDVREATDMYVECDGKLKRDYRGLAVVLNARVKAWFLERSTATPASTGEQS